MGVDLTPLTCTFECVHYERAILPSFTDVPRNPTRDRYRRRSSRRPRRGSGRFSPIEFRSTRDAYAASQRGS
jgi:hypothetical protein